MAKFSKGDFVRFEGKKYQVFSEIDNGHTIILKDPATGAEVRAQSFQVIPNTKFKVGDRVNDQGTWGKIVEILKKNARGEQLYGFAPESGPAKGHSYEILESKLYANSCRNTVVANALAWKSEKTACNVSLTTEAQKLYKRLNYLAGNDIMAHHWDERKQIIKKLESMGYKVKERNIGPHTLTDEYYTISNKQTACNGHETGEMPAGYSKEVTIEKSAMPGWWIVWDYDGISKFYEARSEKEARDWCQRKGLKVFNSTPSDGEVAVRNAERSIFGHEAKVGDTVEAKHGIGKVIEVKDGTFTYETSHGTFYQNWNDKIILINSSDCEVVENAENPNGAAFLSLFGRGLRDLKKAEEMLIKYKGEVNADSDTKKVLQQWLQRFTSLRSNLLIFADEIGVR